MNLFTNRLTSLNSFTLQLTCQHNSTPTFELTNWHAYQLTHALTHQPTHSQISLFTPVFVTSPKRVLTHQFIHSSTDLLLPH